MSAGCFVGLTWVVMGRLGGKKKRVKEQKKSLVGGGERGGLILRHVYSQKFGELGILREKSMLLRAEKRKRKGWERPIFL